MLTEQTLTNCLPCRAAFPVLPFQWMGVASDSHREPEADLFRYGRLARMGRSFRTATTHCRTHAIWSTSCKRDGKRLFAEGFQARGELVRYDLSSHQFVPFLSGSSVGDLAFSTDGKWIAYVSYPERTLWRSRADGSDRRQLTFPPIVAAMPRWSPDASQLAFLDMEAGIRWKILLLSAEGGVPQEVLTEDLFQAD